MRWGLETGLAGNYGELHLPVQLSIIQDTRVDGHVCHFKKVLNVGTLLSLISQYLLDLEVNNKSHRFFTIFSVKFNTKIQAKVTVHIY